MGGEGGGQEAPTGRGGVGGHQRGGAGGVDAHARPLQPECVGNTPTLVGRPHACDNQPPFLSLKGIVVLHLPYISDFIVANWEQ